MISVHRQLQCIIIFGWAWLIMTPILWGQSYIRSRPPECRCQFEMPGIPQHKLQALSTDVGEVIFHSYVLEGKHAGQYLSSVVNFADYPAGALNTDSTDFITDFFDTSIDQAVDQLNGVLVYQTEISHRDFPGRLYRIDYGDGLSVKSMVFLAGNRFYLIQAFYIRDREKGHLADKFLESFRIL